MQMMRTIAGAALVVLVVAGTAMAAPEGDAAGAPAVAQEGGASGAEAVEVKDPLQFGPLKVGLDALVRGESTRNFN